MCDECCKELKGWCRAFTGTERALTILEALLLVILFVFLIFLILHLLACGHLSLPDEGMNTVTDKFIVQHTIPDYVKSSTTQKHFTAKTMDPERECSWTPSAKTTAPTHYYEKGTSQAIQHTTSKSVSKKISIKKLPVLENFTLSDESDGMDADEFQKQFMFALVKLKPPQDVVFGCILTAARARKHTLFGTRVKFRVNNVC